MSGSNSAKAVGPGPIIAVLVFGVGLAKATGGTVLPGHEWIGAGVVFAVAILFLTAGWFLRGWGSVTSEAVQNIIHDELDALREDLDVRFQKMQDQEEARRHDIWEAIDRKAEKSS